VPLLDATRNTILKNELAERKILETSSLPAEIFKARIARMKERIT
jgi:hypothetical protein